VTSTALLALFAQQAHFGKTCCLPRAKFVEQERSTQSPAVLHAKTVRRDSSSPLPGLGPAKAVRRERSLAWTRALNANSVQRMLARPSDPRAQPPVNVILGGQDPADNVLSALRENPRLWEIQLVTIAESANTRMFLGPGHAQTVHMVKFLMA